MKKLILFLFAVIVATTVNAQKAVETSRFTDNMGLTFEFGGVSPLGNDFCKNGSLTPFIGLGIEKYVTPWLGFEIEGRTSIGTGDSYNSPTAFDMVNVSFYNKLNLANIFGYKGVRNTFEPVLYAGLGWGHYTYSDITHLKDIYAHNSATVNVNGTNARIGLPSEDYKVLRNQLTGRVGCELGFNLGPNKIWCIGLDPSFTWGNIDNGRLDKNHCYFELAAFVKVHLPNADGSHTFKVHDVGALNDQINALRAENETLKNTPAQVIEKTTTTTVEKTIDKQTIVEFAFDSDELSASAKSTLDRVNASEVVVLGYASPEGDSEYNKTLSEHRAANVADYLSKRGVKIVSCEGQGAVENTSNRLVYVIAK